VRVAQGDNQHGFDYRIEALRIEDLSDLAAGLVPHTLRAQALSLLDYEDHIRRNSEKPITKSKRRISRAEENETTPTSPVLRENRHGR